MSGKLGELPQDAAELVLRTPSGVPHVPSPFFKGKTEARLPAGFEWLRDFKNELVEASVDAAVRRVYKTRAPHWIEPPFDHTVIDRQERVNAPGLAVTTPILTLTINHNEMARIRFYIQDINPVPPAVLPATAWQDVLWSFRVNGTPLPDYNLFAGQRGGGVMGPAETTIILNDSDTFQILATNNNAANFWITAGIRGWRWSTLSTNIPKEDILKIN